MKKILYTATSDIHINTFHLPYIKWLQKEGYEVHLSVENRANIDLSFCDKVFYVPFKRTPFNFQNIKALKILRKVVKKEAYSLIHCHTPMASVITRLAGLSERKKGCKILYTSHGFHFSNEAPVKNWILYYPVEKLLAKFTDVIITINKEDFLIARDKLKVKEAYQLKSIGVDTGKFDNRNQSTKRELREKNSISDKEFILFYAADFIPRKNHSFLIQAMKLLKDKIPEVKLYLAGTGSLFDEMQKKADDLGVSNHVKFLGWRDDVNEWAALADVGVSASKIEGLGLGLAETMYCKVPIVASNTKGHKELIEHGTNGFIYQQENKKEFVEYINYLYLSNKVREKFGEACKEKVKDFSIEHSLNKMKRIYKRFLG